MLDFHPQCNRHRFGEDTQVTDDDSQVRYHIQQKHREDRKGRHVTQFQWYQYTEWSEDQHSVQPGHLMSLSPPPTSGPSYCAPVPTSNTWGGCPAQDPLSSLNYVCQWASHWAQNASGDCAERRSEKRVITDKSRIKGTNVYGNLSITVSIETFVDLWLGKKALHLGHSFLFFSKILNKNLK